MIERQSMRRPRAAVVTGQKEPVVAERCHDLDLILGHDAERVVDVVGATIGGADAIAVAAKVGRNDAESLRQATGDLVPRGVCERVAVQQQEWRALAAMPQEDVGTARTNPSRLEAVEQADIRRNRRQRGSSPRRGLRENFTSGRDEIGPERSRRGGDEMSAVQLHDIPPGDCQRAFPNTRISGYYTATSRPASGGQRGFGRGSTQPARRRRPDL